MDRVKFKQQYTVTMLAGVFAAISVQNVAHFFIELGHPVMASWTLGFAIGTALVILAHLLSEIDMREKKAFAGLLTVTLILVCLSGIIQGLEYSHKLGNMGYLLAFTLAATGEIVLPLAHSWHNEAMRRKVVNDAGQRVEEIAAQTLVDTMSGVDTTKAKRQAERRIEQLVVANVDNIVHKLMPKSYTADGKGEQESTSESVKPDTVHRSKRTDLDSEPVTARQEKLLNLLQEYSVPADINVSKLAQEMDVSRPTVYRDLDKLQASGRLNLNGHVEVKSN